VSGLASFRSQHPQYNDMSDAALADALHAKFYSDIPKAQYLQSLGLAPAETSAAAPAAPARAPGIRERYPITASGVEMAAGAAGGIAGAKGGAVLGAAAGAAGGPLAPVTVPLGMLVGGILGGGLGYGASREAAQVIDRMQGTAARETPAEMARRAGGNVATGAALEAGGQAAGRVLAPVLGAGARVVGNIRDLPNRVNVKAANMLRAAAGGQLDEVLNRITNAAPGQTPAQAIAPAQAPVLQSMLDAAGAIRAEVPLRTATRQNEQVVNNLRTLAGATTVTEGRQAARAGQNALNDRLIPILETEMAAANTAGQRLPALTAQADRMAGAAAAKVDDVRRFTAAGERAVDNVRTNPPVPGYPRAPVQYTYMGELAQRAEQVAETAARGSLAFGEAARFSRAAADSLAAHGLKPLTAAPVIARIQAKLADPKTMPGNDVLQGALKQVSDDIAQWTKSGGVIDAWALDSIRKNSVNAAVARLRPGMDAKAQNKLAAGILGDVGRITTDAIEEAGGTGYRQYLKSYAEGMRQVNERKMGAELLRLFEKNPTGFVDIVDGNNPKAVEKIFGPGNIDIKEQMSPSAMKMLREAADLVKTNAEVARQVPLGTAGRADIIQNMMPTWQIPNQLDPRVTAANRVLSVVGARMNRKVLERLTAASQDGRTLQQLLETVPAADRVELLRTLNDRSVMTPAVARALTGIGTNMLAPESANELAR
jgi:hypothetical protein